MNERVSFLATRLSLFVVLAAAASVAGAQSDIRAKNVDGWEVKTAKSNLDSSSLIDLIVKATPPAAGWAGGVTPSLTLRCVEHALWATVVTGPPNPHASGADQAAVSYQIDGKAQQTEQWNQVRSGDAVMAADPAAFIRKLLTAKTLHFEAPMVQGANPVFDFPLTGLSLVIGKLTVPCPLGKDR